MVAVDSAQADRRWSQEAQEAQGLVVALQGHDWVIVLVCYSFRAGQPGGRCRMRVVASLSGQPYPAMSLNLAVLAMPAAAAAGEAVIRISGPVARQARTAARQVQAQATARAVQEALVMRKALTGVMAML